MKGISAAYSYSPATASALVKEMRASLPFDLAFIDKYVPQSFGKAYRFVREMKEMEEFVHDNVDATNTYRNRDSKVGCNLRALYIPLISRASKTG